LAPISSDCAVGSFISTVLSLMTSSVLSSIPVTSPPPAPRRLTCTPNICVYLLPIRVCRTTCDSRMCHLQCGKGTGNRTSVELCWARFISRTRDIMFQSRPSR
jgi:hypothetical protein